MYHPKRLAYDNYEIRLKELSEMSGNGQIVADLAFQANRHTRWSKKDCSEFVTSVLLGRSPHKIILADIKKCLEYAISKNNIEDIEYFESWDEKGVLYLNVDGNNRIINSYSFFYLNEVSVLPGVYDTGENDNLEKIIKGKNDTYETLNEAVRNAYDNSTMSVQIYTNASREELSSIFESANSGVTLNHPEKRNSSTSQTASTIRNLAEEYEDLFFNKSSKWFTAGDVNRRGIDDFFAGLFLIFLYGYKNPITKDELKKMYRVDSESNSKTKAFEKHFRSFAKIIENNKELYAVPMKNSVLDLFIIYTKMVKEKKVFVKDMQNSFCKAFMMAYNELLKDTNLHTLPGNAVSKTFKKMTSGRRADSNAMRHELITRKMDLSKYFVQISGGRSATPLTKFQSAMSSNMRTPEQKLIDLSKLHDGETYHGGHKKPFADGGSNGLDNIVIQEARDNLKLGRKEI